MPPRQHEPTGVIVSKILVLLFVGIHCINIEYMPLIGGLDPSWIYTINYAALHDLQFVFTSGPWGFLNYPTTLGTNLELAIVVRLLVSGTVWGLFACLVWKNRVHLPNAVLFAVMFAFGSSWSFDYFLSFIVLFLLALTLVRDAWQRYYMPALMITAFLGLIKLSAAILTVSSCLLCASIMLCRRDVKDKIRLVLLTGIGLPGLFATLYFLHHPSFSGMMEYVRNAYEISSGYNVAMSLAGERRRALLLAGAAACAYLTLLYVLQKTKQASFFIAIICLPAVFIAFKHSFVRQDRGHQIIFFTVTLTVFGLVFLFTDFKLLKRSSLLLLVPALIPSLSPHFLWYVPSPNMLHTLAQNVRTLSGISKLRTLGQVLDYSAFKHSLCASSQQQFQDYMLPQDWLQHIGEQSVAVFPWDSAYIPANELNYSIFPVIQTYSAYTSHLDALNADFLRDTDTAPPFILMEWLAMHGRHPLMNVPATWLALYQWYDVAHYADHLSPSWYHLAPGWARSQGFGSLEGNRRPLMLLQRRPQPRFEALEFIERREWRIGEFQALPTTGQPLVIKLSMHLTHLGKLAKLFYKIPAVNLECVGEAGATSFRIVPDTLQGGLMLNPLPLKLNDIAMLMQTQQTRSRLYAVKLSGPGARFYESMLTVELYRIPNLELEEAALPPLSSLVSLNSSSLGHLDEVSRIEADEAGSYLLVRGWAVDEQTQALAGGVYLDIDGSFYPAYYGFPREDVAHMFQEPGYRFSGFQGAIPIAEIGKGPHEVAMKVLTSGQHAYYNPHQRRRFTGQ